MGWWNRRKEFFVAVDDRGIFAVKKEDDIERIERQLGEVRQKFSKLEEWPNKTVEQEKKVAQTRMFIEEAERQLKMKKEEMKSRGL